LTFTQEALTAGAGPELFDASGPRLLFRVSRQMLHHGIQGCGHGTAHRWRWQIVEDGQGESRILAESGDHKSETACRDELDRLIDACRKDRRPNPVLVTLLV
jgi:hypothetical protein